jgi:hypothetical protein
VKLVIVVEGGRRFVVDVPPDGLTILENPTSQRTPSLKTPLGVFGLEQIERVTLERSA